MYLFGVVSLVPAAPSWALTNCTEKHEPCRGLATHTHTHAHTHRANRLSWASGWGVGVGRGFNHVAYRSECSVLQDLSPPQSLPLTKVCWEVTTQSESDRNDFTADRKLRSVLQREWKGQVSPNILIEAVWDGVMIQRAKHLLLYLLTYSYSTGLARRLKAAFPFARTLKSMSVWRVTLD